ncbi:hypothetical protein ACN469_09200 [Corallococcus terminator]
MRTLLCMLIAVPLLAGCGGDDADSCGDNASPETYKSARRVTCSGTSEADVACCGYSSDTCSYTLCRKSVCGEWTEESWSCR